MRFSFRRASIAVTWGVPLAVAVAIAAIVAGREAEPPTPNGPPPRVVGPGGPLIPAPISPDAYTAPSLAFSPDGRDLAAGWVESGSPIVALRDVGTGRERWRIAPPVSESLCLAFSPDGLSLAVGPSERGDSGPMKLYDVRDGEERSPSKSAGRLSYYQHLAFSPDGRYVAGTRQGRVWVLNESKDESPWEGRLDSRELYDVAFSPDGRYVAAAGDGPMKCRGFAAFGFSSWSCGVKGGAVGLWDVATGERLLDLQPPQRARTVAFSPDGSTLASGGWDGLRLWSLPEGRGRWVVSGRVERLAYTTDGRSLALLIGKTYEAEAIDEVWIWDVTAERVRTILRGVPGSPRALAFSPDGRAVVVGGDEGIVRWDLETERG